MLRITNQQNPANVTLSLEGDLTGVWVGEFLQAWRAARRVLNGRLLRVDLNAVGRIDKSGEYGLALVHCHGAQLEGSGLVTRDLIHAIARDWSTNTPTQVVKEAY